MPSRIEWTNKTWNPVTGCEAVSEGCRNCYAATMTKRLESMGHKQYAGLLNVAGHFNGTVKTHPDRLQQPFHWKKPLRVFVCSMSDLFHKDVPSKFLYAVWCAMAACPQHTFQVLTKRPERIARALGPRGCGFYAKEGVVPCPQPNVWVGTSIENQGAFDRWENLVASPAAVRFVSAEPLIGPWKFLGRTMPDWVIVGAEKGPGSRPMDDDWARALRDQCQEAGTAFFMKQRCKNGKAIPYEDWPDDLQVREYPEDRNHE
jgi:protein gp37